MRARVTMLMRRYRGSLCREEGAAAVEFALIVGVLAMLIFGMLQFGVLFWQIQNLRAAAREGARVAAVRGSEDEIRARMASASAGSLPDSGNYFTVPTGLCTSERTGEEVTVLLTNPALPGDVQDAFSVDIPFMPPFSVDPDLSGTFRCE